MITIRTVLRHDLRNLCHALLLLTCVVFLVITLRFCTCMYKLPASAYFKVRGGAFDLAVEVTQI